MRRKRAPERRRVRKGGPTKMKMEVRVGTHAERVGIRPIGLSIIYLCKVFHIT
jgi:hypothetical protein